MFKSIEEVEKRFAEQGYIADRTLATTVYLAAALGKPIFLEGEPGVGKTEVAKVMAQTLATNLIRLQCYEGLDANTALYEWNYPRQMLELRLEEARGIAKEEIGRNIFSQEFLLKRPLLQAIQNDAEKAPVLLIDEIDRCVAGDTLIFTPEGFAYAREVRVGDYMVAFDPVAFDRRISRVKKVTVRRTERLLRIYAGGRILDMTPEHRMIRFDEEGNHQDIQAKDIRVGDLLPVDKRVPTPECSVEPAFEFEDGILKLTPEGKRILYQGYRISGMTYKQIGKKVGVSGSHLRNVIAPYSIRNSLRHNVLKKLCTLLKIDFSEFHRRHADGFYLNQNSAFYEILGYIVADGCFSSDRLFVADKDRRNIEVYARKFEEAFGKSPRIISGPHKNYALQFHSLPLGRFLRRVLVKGMGQSRFRKLRRFLFMLPKAKRAAFLRGYFDGEASVGTHYISAATASKQLAVQVQMLLGSLGIDSFIYFHDARKGSFGFKSGFEILIYDTERFRQVIGFNAPSKKTSLERLPGRRFHKTDLLPKRLILPPLAHIRTTRVLSHIDARQTVYDLLSGRIRPNLSSARRIAKQFADPGLEELVSRDLALSRVTRIEEIEEPQEVYDFTLAGDPYFVGNGLVTHNCDEEFEAFLLEVLSDFQITIPEIGTVRAGQVPFVVLTSNRTRELHDALKRRCLYLWIDYPSFGKEMDIIHSRVPGIREGLAEQVCGFMQLMRTRDFYKRPGIAETIDWGLALMALGIEELDAATVDATLGCVLKYKEDIEKLREDGLPQLIEKARLLKERFAQR